jgi:hypothetical protein
VELGLGELGCEPFQCRGGGGVGCWLEWDRLESEMWPWRSKMYYLVASVRIRWELISFDDAHDKERRDGCEESAKRAK